MPLPILQHGFMHHGRRSLAGLLLLWSLTLSMRAAAEPLDSLNGAVSRPADQPSPSAVIEFDREHLTIDASGRMHTRREFRCRILSAEGREHYREQVIGYQENTHAVVIDSARIQKADGRWITLDSTAFVDAPAPEVKWIAGYSQFRQLTVSFTAVDSGDAVYFAYRLEPLPVAGGRAAVPPGGIALFGGPDPILEKTVTVDVVEPFRLRWELTNSDLKPLVVASNHHSVYTWTRLNCPALDVSPPVVDAAFILPRLVWTTCPDWEALGTAFNNLFWDKVDSSLAAVDSFMAGTPPTLQGIPALMNATRWVQQNVRPVNRTAGRVDAALHTADWIVRERYADPQDKAVLLTALLRGYGFGPIPVLVPGRLLPFF